MPIKPFTPENIKPIHFPDAQFGIRYDAEELLMKIKNSEPVPPHEMELPHGYIRPWKDPDLNDVGTTIFMEVDKYEAILDVQQFSPEELNVSIVGVHSIAVECNQVGKEEKGGPIDRYMRRVLYVPPAYDFSKIECKLSSDRIIVITIPALNLEEYDEKKNVPIVLTGEPLLDEVNKRLKEIKKNDQK